MTRCFSLRFAASFFFVLLGWLSAPLDASTSVPEPRAGLLLRWELTLEELGSSSKTEYLVYKDGLVIIRSQAGTTLRLSRAQASAEALSALNRTLGQNRIGSLQTARCAASNPYPDEVSFDAAVTWFGRNGRQNRLLFGSLGGEVVCSAQVEALLYGMLVFLDSLVYSDSVVTVP